MLSRSYLHGYDSETKVDVRSDGLTYLFMTDWPTESLRATQNAIELVGYDTMELLAIGVHSG